MEPAKRVYDSNIYEKPGTNGGSPLSGFYMIDIVYNDKVYPSSEHLYQSIRYAKYPAYAELIRTMRTPYAARILSEQKHSGGQKKAWMITQDKHINDFRAVNRYKPKHDVELMKIAVCEKLKHPIVLEALQATTGNIIYHSDYDIYWAIKYSRAIGMTGPNAWWDYEGYNVLGKLLTEIRDAEK